MIEFLEYFKQPQTLKTIYFMGGCCFIFLFFLAATNTVIIFENYGDFYWSLGILLCPILLLIGQEIIAPHSEIRPLEYNIYWETLNHKLLTLIGLITFVMSLSITFYNSVKNNGLILGIIIFSFKVFACLISVILILGIIAEIFGTGDQNKRKRTLRSLLVALIVFKVLKFFIKKLVNGENVMKKRKLSRLNE